MAMNTKTALFWDVMLYSLVDRYQQFEALPLAIPWIKSVAFHRKDPGSITGQYMWDFWWTKWHYYRFSFSTSVFPCQYEATSAAQSIIY